MQGTVIRHQPAPELAVDRILSMDVSLKATPTKVNAKTRTGKKRIT